MSRAVTDQRVSQMVDARHRIHESNMWKIDQIKDGDPVPAEEYRDRLEWAVAEYAQLFEPVLCGPDYVARLWRQTYGTRAEITPAELADPAVDKSPSAVALKEMVGDLDKYRYDHDLGMLQPEP